MIDQEKVLKRIDEILDAKIDENPNVKGPYVYSATLSIALMLYGESSSQVQVLKDIYSRVSNLKARVDLMHIHLISRA